MKEFDHIVWPTTSETKKYFVTVVAMISILTVLLFIVGTALSAGLFSIKSQMTPVSAPVTTAPTSDLKLDGLKVDTTPVKEVTPSVKETAPVVPKK